MPRADLRRKCRVLPECANKGRERPASAVGDRVPMCSKGRSHAGPNAAKRQRASGTAGATDKRNKIGKRERPKVVRKRPLSLSVQRRRISATRRRSNGRKTGIRQDRR